jgi:ferredoxin-like protein FixX
MLIKEHLIVEYPQNNGEKKENNKDKNVNNMNFKKNKKGHACCEDEYENDTEKNALATIAISYPCGTCLVACQPNEG